jgi:hypothetical protein
LQKRGFCCKNGCRNCPFEFRQKAIISKLR